MFIPLRDANNLRHIQKQYVTIGLIAANCLVYLLTAISAENAVTAAVMGLGYIPSVAFETVQLPPEYVLVPESATYLTYAFLHADLWHLGGNMLFLWVFGDNVEDALGHVRFLIFYLACAAFGAFVHGLAAPDSQAPLIGASGAVAGIVSAYLILHPRVRVWILAFGRIPLPLPAWIALVAWIAFQFFMFAAAGEEEISWAAHVGGIVAGAVLVLVMRRKGVPLFDRHVVTPAAVEVAAGDQSSGEPHYRGPWGRRS